MVERFVGLDVSQRLTSVCILDERGGRVWRGKCVTDPAVIAEGIVNLTGHGRDDAHGSDWAYWGHPMRATPVTSAQVWKAWVRAARYWAAGRR